MCPWTCPRSSIADRRSSGIQSGLCPSARSQTVSLLLLTIGSCAQCFKVQSYMCYFFKGGHRNRVLCCAGAAKPDAFWKARLRRYVQDPVPYPVPETVPEYQDVIREVPRRYPVPVYQDIKVPRGARVSAERMGA